jgi:hypothetical protein
MSKIDESLILYVNSTDRVSGSDSDFTYKIPVPINNNFDRIVCLEASIPKTYYTVLDGYNYFDMQEGASPLYRIFVTPGNYTKNGLAIVLGQLLHAGSMALGNNHQYTVTYPDINTGVDDGKYTFNLSNNGGVQSTFYFYGREIFIHESLGFVPNSVNHFVANVLKSTHVIDLQPFNCCQIHTDLVSNDLGSDYNANDVLQTVFINNDSPPYQSVLFQCDDFEAYSHKLSSNTKQFARIYLTDEDDIPLDLNQNSMQMTILLYKKNKSNQLLTGFIKYMTTFIELIRKKIM